MMAAANEIAEEVILKAKEDYIQKKIAKRKFPSMIFTSFFSDPPTSNNNEVRKTVFSGAPDAPWLKWVNDGHSYSNGTIFEGHHFIEVGVKAGDDIAESVVNKQFNKMR